MTGDRRRADDAALVREVAAGSEDALGMLYDQYVDAVYAASSRLTADRQIAEEVVQETFLALWNRAELFDPAVGSLAAWLHTIARNRTVDRLRARDGGPASSRSRRRAARTSRTARRWIGWSRQGPSSVGRTSGPGPEGELATTELRQVLREALEELPDAERTAIVLAYREELSQTEIAERLGWPLGTVKTRTRRALLRLRGALADELGPGAAPAAIPVPITERMNR